VASLLRLYGLLRPGNEAVVPYAIRMMLAIRKARDKKGAWEQQVRDYFELATRFKATMSRECKPWFVGVWDTVSSVGWIENPLKLPYTADNPDIEVGRHAIAIDERRAFFRSNLWRKGDGTNEPHGPRDELQVWFPGVHSDVGGGYPEAESGLSKLALEWMLDEAEEYGLKVDPQRRLEVLGRAPVQGYRYVPPDVNGMMHESLTGAWKLAEYLPKPHYNSDKNRMERRMNLSRRRTIPPGSVIHWSAYERKDKYAARLPGDVTRLAKKQGVLEAASSRGPAMNPSLGRGTPGETSR
jgi:uncharacterized protein (DUF2235 family)